MQKAFFELGWMLHRLPSNSWVGILLFLDSKIVRSDMARPWAGLGAVNTLFLVECS
jgi:hypothetical protein